MEKEKIAIYGAGGFGREVAWLAQSVACKDKQVEVACFIDDNDKICDTIMNDIRVVSLKRAKEEYNELLVISGIGIPKIREVTMQKATLSGFRFTTLVHSRVEMSKWINIGEGTVICAGSILTTNIQLGKHVQINLDCTIGHDVVMDDYATLAPGVHISGFVRLGKRVYVGTGAVIINGSKDFPIVIGDDASIGAGTCVTKSIPSGETWAGVPARPIRK